MSEVNRILSINTIDGLLKYEITVKTVLIVAVISGLFLLAIVSYFGGVTNTIEYCRSKLHMFLNAYGVKMNVPVSKKKESNVNIYTGIDKGIGKDIDTDNDKDIDKDIDKDKDIDE